MTKRKNKSRQHRSEWIVLFVLTCLGLLIAMLLKGNDIALFNPKGAIAQQELDLIIFSMALMLTVALPTMIILYGFAWEYRVTNKKARYEPEARHSKFFVPSMWALPTIVMLVLASVMWPAAHKLDPKKAIAADAKPLTIQVVALRWKWLFIYPEQNIATVNYVEIPIDTPVNFVLTADETPMSSFWIPHLGGQLYAMTGHVNQLNLIAQEAGDYQGSSAEINGAGFAGMKFIARASSIENFDKWVKDTQQTNGALDGAEYEKLVEPSEHNRPVFYSSVETGLYAKMLMKYMGSHDHQPAKYEAEH
jgi:cytochrome o ubiquinol oxidase subunit II